MKYINHFLIIFSGLLIAFLIIYKDSREDFKINDIEIPSPKKAFFIEDGDIIIGNKDANFFFIEYIDLQCPSCKEFHPHLHSLIASRYVTSGEVAVVIRHGPHIDNLSTEKALATECVRRNYGDNKALSFIDQTILVVEETQYPTERIEKIFNNLGISLEKIKQCKSITGDVRIKFEQKTKDIISSLQIIETPYIQILDNNGTELYSASGVHTFEELTNLFFQLLE